MHETLWYLIIGAVLLGMGVVTSALRHLPCSSAMIYLVLGIALGPAGAGLLHLDLERDGQLLREIVEVALLVSLFPGVFSASACCTSGGGVAPCDGTTSK